MGSKLGFINRIVKPFGVNIARSNTWNSQATMEQGLQRAKAIRNINPATIIDIGAAEGTWTSAALKLWPGASYVLFEPLKERKETLTSLGEKNTKIHFVNKAAGNGPGVIDLYVTADLDGSGIADNGTDTELRKVEQASVDQELTDLKLAGPYVLKLDTHGYEVPIIEGAVSMLENTELVIIECYGFEIAPISLLFWDMCNYMMGKGFRLIDIVDVELRKKDAAFWQCDAFFVPINSPVFSSKTYV
jgi:FkbM family methyltransferase